MKKLAFFLFLAGAVPQLFAAEEPVVPRGSEESLFLDLKKVDVGTISSAEEKRQYLMTIQLEKQRVQHHMLGGIYDNAYRLYKEGDYEQSQELARKILSIDPNYQDARLLMQASGELGGARRGVLSESALIDEKFSQGLGLYKEGRLVEAARLWDDVLKLSPGNLKASYWLKKANREIAAEHLRRGNIAYSEHRLDEALMQWYNALLLKKGDQEIIGKIAEVENELRADRANKQLQLALDYYGQGKVVQAYKALKEVLVIQPGDSKAQKLAEEVRNEIGGSFITSGKKAYSARRYNQAIEQWDKAKEWGYDKKYVNLLIARAKEQMRRDEEAKLRKAEEAQRAAAEDAERERREAEEARKARMQQEMGNGGTNPDGSSLPGATQDVSAENKKAARQHYLRGLIFFQQNDYDKAREEWTISKQLDPGYSEPDAGLKRIEEMYAQ
ncbi:MAG: tetratricopeptide repeat protein [Elusimicrobiaceae bacterium]|nr:tetratricopeptide repeat protein [Elusimicrobiaceae bacterium]